MSAVAAHGPLRTAALFHGGTRRYDYGVRLRTEATLRILNKTATATATPEDGKMDVDLRIAEMTRGTGDQFSGDNWAAYVASGQAYGVSSICMSPAGDTLTSRRLYDALSGGCVPVLSRSSYLFETNGWAFGTALPFPSLIDWPRISLQMLAKRTYACEVRAAKWLAEWHASKAARDDLEAMRQRGERAFRLHLDYTRNPQGVIDAVLLEALLRRRAPIPLCQLGTVRRYSTSLRPRPNATPVRVVGTTVTQAWYCRQRFANETEDEVNAAA